ncbi:MAG: transglutaminase family protein [Chitinophagaceae bacterium]|nr:transglutaminase family protein [Chitinophagaceae bacterium]
MNSYTIKHTTRYSYSSTVIDCANQIMLYPLVDAHLEVRKHEVKISHSPLVEVFVDYFGNEVGVFSVIKPHKELLIESVTDVITKKVTMPTDDIPAAEQWEHFSSLKGTFPYLDFLTREVFPSLDEVKIVLDTLLNYSETPFANAKTFTDYVYNNFSYQQGITTTDTEVEEIWQLKAGVCQDFAHILLVLLRMADIPGRYVSGYICPKDKEMRGTGATHAWVEAYIPWFGWIGLDPTNNCVVNDQHVRLAVGRRFADCTPVKGTFKGSATDTLEVSVEIENGHSAKKTEASTGATFKHSQKSKPAAKINSYRHYLEVQQQQQQ